MRAVISEVPRSLFRERQRTGADRWDEMWEGVLHMAPAPNKWHTRLQVQLHNWLDAHWPRPLRNQVDLLVNIAPIGGWPDDYRIPDIVLLTPDRFSIDRNDHYEGAPTVVIEIRSPGDETLEKLSFYARLGVPEVWIVDRKTRVPERFALAEGAYRPLPAGKDRWIRSPITGVQLRTARGNQLEIQSGGGNATRRSLPE